MKKILFIILRLFIIFILSTFCFIIILNNLTLQFVNKFPNEETELYKKVEFLNNIFDLNLIRYNVSVQNYIKGVFWTPESGNLESISTLSLFFNNNEEEKVNTGQLKKIFLGVSKSYILNKFQDIKYNVNIVLPPEVIIDSGYKTGGDEGKFIINIEPNLLSKFVIFILIFLTVFGFLKTIKEIFYKFIYLGKL
jgi:hypothetical protein